MDSAKPHFSHTTVHPSAIEVKVYNDSWHFGLTYHLHDLRSTDDEEEEHDTFKQGTFVEEHLIAKRKLELFQFPLTVTTPTNTTSGADVNNACALTLPSTACNIRVFAKSARSSDPQKYSYDNDFVSHERVQHLVLPNPLLHDARVISLHTRDVTGIQQQESDPTGDNSTSTRLVEIARGDIVGIYDDVVVINNLETQVRDGSVPDLTAYVKTKDYLIVGESPKDKKIMFERSKVTDETDVIVIVHFDIAFVYNAATEYDSLLNLRTDGFPIVDGRGFYQPQPSLMESNNTGRNLLANFLTQGNPKLKTQFNKSWYIDHSLTFRPTSNISDVQQPRNALGDFKGKLETWVAIKPNWHLPIEYAVLDKVRSRIFLVPSNNLSPGYRNLVRRVTLTVPDGTNTLGDKEVGEQRVYATSSRNVATASLTTAAVAYETSAEKRNEPDDNDSEENSPSKNRALWYGTPLKARNHLLSKTQTIYYTLGEMEVSGKDIKICGWKFPSEELTKMYTTHKGCQRCEVFNALVLKGNKVFDGIKAGPLAILDDNGTKIKATETPVTHMRYGYAKDGEDEEENGGYYESSIGSTFNGGMTLRENTCHFFLTNPEKIKITRELIGFETETRNEGKTKREKKEKEKEEKERPTDEREDVSVIEAKYKITVKHTELRFSSKKKGDDRDDDQIEPYLLLMVVHNATRVELSNYNSTPEKPLAIFEAFNSFLRHERKDSEEELTNRFSQTYPALAGYKKELEKFLLTTSYGMFEYVDSNSNQMSFADYVVCVLPITKRTCNYRLRVRLEKRIPADRESAIYS